jgi:hypothetical protein
MVTGIGVKMSENKFPPIPLEMYARALNLSADEVSVIAFDHHNRIIVVTKTDGDMIKYEQKFSDQEWQMLCLGLPVEFRFVGFQHAVEGNSFLAFAKLS